MLRRTEVAGAINDKLFFAQVREDPALELAAFENRGEPRIDGPIAVVSSAGCTALSLAARGFRVVAVDINRTQNHLVEFKGAAVSLGESALGLLGAAPMAPTLRMEAYQRIRGALSPAARGYWDARPAVIGRGVLQAGVTERLMRVIASSVRLLQGRRRVERLLALETLEQQQEFFQKEWDSARWRLLFEVLCNRLVLRGTYDERFFANVENASYAKHFRQVAEHTLTELPVSGNYFLHYLFTGRYPPADPPPYLAGRAAAGTIELVDGAFIEYLRQQPDESMAGFSLSNICEWLTAAQIDGLFAEIVRTAKPGARLVFRNLVGWTDVPEKWQQTVREDRAAGERLMRQDRSLCQRRFALCEVTA